MYGKSDVDFPRRIVCLTAEHVEICYALGAGDRVVGVPGTARPAAEARGQAQGRRLHDASASTGSSALEPDLVLAFSDLQADVERRADPRRRRPCSAPTSARSTRSSRPSSIVGGVLGREPAAPAIWSPTCATRSGRCASTRACGRDRPRVYFEEWPDPLIAGHPLGVRAHRDRRRARRLPRAARAAGARASASVSADEVVRRDPEIILASWCGKPVDLAAIAARPGLGRA